MFKKLLFSVILCILAVSMVFSGGSGEQGSQASQPKGGSKFVQIKSSSIGGTWYAGGAAWAKLITDNTDYVATNSASPGLDNETMRRISEGRAHLGFVTGAGAYLASRGEGGWEKPLDIKGIFTIWASSLCTVVHAGSSYKSMEDLKGARIATYVEGDVNGDQALALLKHHGVTEENSRIYKIMKADATRMFVDRTVDALIYQYSPGHADLRQIVASREIRFLPPNKAMFEAFYKENPFYYLAEFGKEFGVNPELQPVVSAFTCTYGSVDEEMIYQFTKVWFENIEWLKTVIPSSVPNMNIKEPTAGIPVEIHPGALRYYKEAGIKH